MTEADQPAAEHDPGAPEQGPVPPAEPVRTGAERVDEVVRAVEELEDRPVEEHVGVFETAHAELRRALDAVEPGDRGDVGDAGGDPAADPSGSHGAPRP